MESKLDQLYTAALNKVEETKQQRKQQTEELLQLEDKSKNLAAIIEDAIAKEDFTAFKKATDEKEKVDFSIAAKKKAIATMKELNPEDFKAEWKAFRNEYEAVFAKNHDEYKAARKALYGQFMTIYELQKKAATLRKAIALACGFGDYCLQDADNTEYERIGLFSGLEKGLGYPRGHRFKMSPDALFFADIGELPEELDGDMYKVIFCKNI